MKLHELSIKKPVAVVMAVLMFVVIGVYSLTMLPMELMPDMNMPIALVMTQYPNVSPEEIENLVTKNIEGAVSSVSGVDSMTSQSSEGMSVVVVQFNNDVDIDKAVEDMSQSIDMIEAYMPEGCEDPMIIKMDTSAMPVFVMSFSVDGYDISQTKKYVDDNVQNRLEAVSGVARVTVTGAQDREIQVVVDPEKVYGYDVSVAQVVGALASGNTNMPGGSIKGNGRDMSIRTMGKIENIYDIETIPMTTTKGQVIYLSDVADVIDSYSERSTYARLNGEDSLSVSITQQSDANTVEVVNSIIKTLETLKAENPNVKYNITMEQASYIENAISSVASNAVTGGILAIVILLLFLASIRSSLIIGISMPVSVITTFIVMYFSDMSLNVVSLGGLALGVGMLVDNSVVVLENIFRHRTELKKDGISAGLDGSAEVVGAVVASVLTTCIVYVPILFIDNIMAVMFKQLSYTIIFSQIVSLIVTFLLVPMLSSGIKNIDGEKNSKIGVIFTPFERFLNFLYSIYEKALRACLKRRKTLIVTMLVLFIISLVTLGRVGMTLMPSSDEGAFTVSVEAPQGTQLEDTNEITEKIEEIIRSNENVESVFSSVGSGSMSLGGSSSNSASVTVTLKDKKERDGSTQDIMETVRESLSDIAGAEISLEATSSTNMSASSDAIEIQFVGNDTAALEEYVNQAADILAGVNGITEVSTSVGDTKSEVRVHIDKNRAQHYGLTVATASQLIKSSIDGQTATQYSEDGKEYDVVVKYPDNYMDDYSKLRNLRLKAPTGQWITLNDIADVSIEKGYTTLTRVDQKRVITLTGKIYGSDMGSVNSEFMKKLESLPMPDGISQQSSGTFEIMMDAMLSLLGAIFLGILLMYMVMAAQFGNLKQPLIIMSVIPLAVIGVVLSLVLDGSPLSVVGCIGILMLTGMIVNNAILLIEFINDLRKSGEYEANSRDAEADMLVRAGKTRLRPILMTTLTTILGFLPMVLSTAEGSEMMRPLAVVLTGGLSVGTVLTLIVIPVLYSMTTKKKAKHAKTETVKTN